MKALNALWFTVRALVRRTRVDAELDEELAFHLDRETATHERDGMSAADARREAMRHFGGIQNVREECRDVRRVSWLKDLRADMRFALRLVRLYPGFSANVILISALGIAACATTFSLVSGILFVGNGRLRGGRGRVERACRLRSAVVRRRPASPRDRRPIIAACAPMYAATRVDPMESLRA
jgi:hypothetical protein